MRAERPRRLPVVLTREEVRNIFVHLHGSSRLVVGLLYGSGLRLNEALELRVKDIDLERRDITVRSGKGNKDRVTVIPLELVRHCAATWQHWPRGSIASAASMRRACPCRTP